MAKIVIIKWVNNQMEILIMHGGVCAFNLLKLR